MGHTQQVKGWLTELNDFREHPAWKTLCPGAVHLIERFIGGLEEMPTDSRANVVGPFTAAINSLLKERGITVDETPLTIRVIEELFKRPDISFVHGKVQWVIEIKTGLEWNSLGAAVLEGLAFKAKFVLLCLYAKAGRGDLLSALEACGVGHAFDHTFVLSRTADTWDVYFDNFAKNLNTFVNELPGDKLASMI